MDVEAGGEDKREVLRGVIWVWGDDLLAAGVGFEPLDVACWFEDGEDVAEDGVDALVGDEGEEELDVDDVEGGEEFGRGWVVDVPGVSFDMWQEGLWW